MSLEPPSVHSRAFDALTGAISVVCGAVLLLVGTHGSWRMSLIMGVLLVALGAAGLRWYRLASQLLMVLGVASVIIGLVRWVS